jgi:Amt family ammonium transporter
LVPADYFPLSAKIIEEGGNTGLFMAQLKAVLFTYGFVGLGTALILWFLGLFMKLRVSAESEDRGLDFIAHGEEAYDPMTN